MHAVHTLLMVEKELMVAPHKPVYTCVMALHVLVRKSAAAKTTLRDLVMVSTRVREVADHQA